MQMALAGEAWRQARTELQQRMKNIAVEEHLSALGHWSIYRSAGLHPRNFVGIDMAVDCMDWPVNLRQEFVALWRPLQNSLMGAQGVIVRWPDSSCQRKAELLAAFIRHYPRCISDLPWPMALFFARLFLLAGQVGLYILHRAQVVARLGLDIDMFEGADDQLPALYRMCMANEQASPDQAFKLLCDLREEPIGHLPEYNDFLQLANLYLPRESATLGAESKVQECDRSFASAIKGKRIAIVGPVNNGLDNGREIDDFDLVIRPNHRSNNALGSRFFGARTDISYYLEDDLRKNALEPDNYLTAMSSLQFVVLSKSCLSTFPWLSRLTGRLRPRFEIGIRCNPFFTGYPSALPRMLMDVLRFAPLEVKVFNADLYLGRRYGGNYLRANAGYTLYPGFTLHDPVSNFIFMQRAWRGGWFNTDPVLAEILSLSVIDYQAAFLRVHDNSDSR